MHTMTMDQILEMRGNPVYSSEGEKIGKVEEIFADEATDQPEWIGIGTGSSAQSVCCVPVEGASMSEDGFTVPIHSGRSVASSAKISSTLPIFSPSEE